MQIDVLMSRFYPESAGTATHLLLAYRCCIDGAFCQCFATIETGFKSRSRNRFSYVIQMGPSAGNKILVGTHLDDLQM